MGVPAGAQALVLALGEVECDLIALHPDFDYDLDGVVADAIGVDHVLASVDAVRNLPQRRSDPRLRIVENAVDVAVDLLAAESPHQLLEANIGRVGSRHLGHQVAHVGLSETDVGEDQLQHLVGHHALPA